MDVERFEPVLSLLDDVPFVGRRRTRATRAWRALGLVALVVAIGARGLAANGFSWRDHELLGAHASWFQFLRAWTWAAGAYSPVSGSLLFAELRLFGSNAVLFHALTLALHALCAVLVWLILRRLAVPGAWLGAALFALHPVQVQPVAWVHEQPIVWCATFSLLTIWMVLRLLDIRPALPEEMEGIEPPNEPGRLARASAYGLAMLTCAAAVLSDPLGISVPFVLVLLLAWKRGGVPPAADWRRLAPFFAIALTGAALGFMLHHPSPERLGVAPIPSIAQRALIAMRGVAFYAANLAWLHLPRFVYGRWDPAAGMGNAIAPLLIGVTFVAAAWALVRRRRWGPAAMAALLLFVAMLAPGLTMLLADPAPAAYVADAREYLASAVPLVALTAALVALLVPRLATRTGSQRTGRAIVGIAILVPLIAFSIVGADVYRDELSPWRTNLARNPSDAIARSQYALALSEEDPAQAVGVLDDAGASGVADSPSIRAARARVCLALGRPDDAIAAALQGQRLAPDDPGLQLLLAEAYESAGQNAMIHGSRTDALQDFDNALAACSGAGQRRPLDPAIPDRAGSVLLHEGLFSDAIDRFDAAIRLDAGYAPAHAHKAAALSRWGLADRDEGLVRQSGDELREALRIDPGNADAFRVAADMDLRQRNWPAAEHDLRAVVRLAPGSAQAWADLGTVLAAEGRTKEASMSFDKALKLRPDLPAAILGKRLASANR